MPSQPQPLKMWYRSIHKQREQRNQLCMVTVCFTLNCILQRAIGLYIAVWVYRSIWVVSAEETDSSGFRLCRANAEDCLLSCPLDFLALLTGNDPEMNKKKKCTNIKYQDNEKKEGKLNNSWNDNSSQHYRRP